MAELFGKAQSTINEHIKNINNVMELLKDETMRKFGNSEFSDKPAIDNNTLAALTILIAESNPKKKYHD